MSILLYIHTGEYNKFDEEKFDRKDFTVDNINFTDDELSEFYDGTDFNDYKSYTEYYSNLKIQKIKDDYFYFLFNKKFSDMCNFELLYSDGNEAFLYFETKDKTIRYGIKMATS